MNNVNAERKCSLKLTSGDENDEACTEFMLKQQKSKSKIFSNRRFFFKCFSLLEIFVVLTVTASLWVLVFLDSNETRQIWWIGTAMGPIGSLFRFGMSFKNQKWVHFPWFTFIPNIFASMANVGILILISGITPKLTAENVMRLKFWLESGIVTGCLGSLSTVSTWIHEIYKLAGLNLWWAYRYGIASVVVGHALCLLLGGIWIATGNDFA